MPSAAPPSSPKGVECRAWPRHPCDTAANCQPTAARGSGFPGWPGTIRNVSSGGIGLVLERRFEIGTTLSVELTGADRRPLLARVVRILRQPDGTWLLGCVLASRLSDEEVRQMRGQAREEPPARCGAGGPGPRELVGDVTLECRTGGQAVRRTVRWLGTSAWPPQPGTLLPVGFKGRVADPAEDWLRVVRCSARDGGWVLEYEPAGRLSAEALHLLGG